MSQHDAPASVSPDPDPPAQEVLAEPAVPDELSDVPDTTEPGQQVEPTEVLEVLEPVPGHAAEPEHTPEGPDDAPTSTEPEPDVPAQPEPDVPAEPEPDIPAEPEPDVLAEPPVPDELTQVQDTTEPAEQVQPPEVAEPVAPTPPAPTPPAPVPFEPSASPSASAGASLPSPSPPRPSPALLAAHAPGASPSAKFGRADPSGVVYVRTADGEKEVGTYPGVSPAHALGYFARRYDELATQADLLLQRVSQTDLGGKEAAELLAKLRAQVGEGQVVGDLAALDATLASVGKAVERKRQAEGEERAAARRAAKAEREQLVAEAESIAGQPEARIQWKSSGARMRELLDLWKEQQRTGPRLDRESEASLWQRFSVARSGFDKARRTHFAQLDSTQAETKATKERLVKEAQSLAESKDWAPTATAFKRLMERWRAAGRASRADDDALWEQFRAAQDSFFAAKDAVSAKENEEFTANLEVKTALLAEAEALLPVSTPKQVETAKGRLRGIQDRWDKVGKVPRSDLERIEKSLRRVEQAVRDADDKRWHSRNPEGAARAQSFVEQLRGAVAGLSADLDRARATGDARKVAEAEAALSSRQQWLRQAESNLTEFGS